MRATHSMVIDFAKQKQADGSYQLVVYELQALFGSVLGVDIEGRPLPEARQLERARQANNEHIIRNLFKHRAVKSYDGLNTGPKIYKQCLDALPEAFIFRHKESLAPMHAHFLYHYYGMGIRADNEREDFTAKTLPDHTLTQLLRSKCLQRYVMNSNPIMRQYLPQKTLIAGVSDLIEPQGATRLLEAFGAGCNLVIKKEDATRGQGNIFIRLGASPEAIIQQLKPHGRFFKLGGLCCVEVVSQLGLSKKTGLAGTHCDTYRAAVVHGDDFYNASIIKKYQSARDDVDSHSWGAQDYYALRHPHRLQVERHEGKIKRYTKHRIDRHKVARNLDLEHHKPKLFEQLKQLSEYIFSLDFDSVAAFYETSTADERLEFLDDKMRAFVATKLQHVQAFRAQYRDHMLNQQAPAEPLSTSWQQKCQCLIYYVKQGFLQTYGEAPVVDILEDRLLFKPQRFKRAAIENQIRAHLDKPPLAKSCRACLWPSPKSEHAFFRHQESHANSGVQSQEEKSLSPRS